MTWPKTTTLVFSRGDEFLQLGCVASRRRLENEGKEAYHGLGLAKVPAKGGGTTDSKNKHEVSASTRKACRFNSLCKS